MGLFWTIYSVLVGLAVLQSVLLIIQTWEHRRYTRSSIKDMERLHLSGRAAVLAPCKGVDVALEDNLRALMQQDHNDYEVTFIVESTDDPACPIIRRVMAAYPHRAARLLVAGRAEGIGQKTHNLRQAIAGLSDDIEVLAFVDSDACPRRGWLRLLVSRLLEGPPVVVTGYRWFIPVRPSIANNVLYSLNCGIMALLGRTSYHVVWGGSWGIRRCDYDAIGLHEAWEETLSDDLVASRQLRRAGIHVKFEPACVVASPLDYSLRDAFTFLRRQYLVARFYAPVGWTLALIASMLTNAATLGSLALWITFATLDSVLAWFPGMAFACLYAMSVGRRFIRQALVRVHFPNREHDTRQARWFDIWCGPIANLANAAALLASAFGRHITWRGIRYRVFPGGRVKSMRQDRSLVDHRAFTHPAVKRSHWIPTQSAVGKSRNRQDVRT